MVIFIDSLKELFSIYYQSIFMNFIINFKRKAACVIWDILHSSIFFISLAVSISEIINNILIQYATKLLFRTPFSFFLNLTNIYYTNFCGLPLHICSILYWIYIQLNLWELNITKNYFIRKFKHTICCILLLIFTFATR